MGTGTHIALATIVNSCLQFEINTLICFLLKQSYLKVNSQVYTANQGVYTAVSTCTRIVGLQLTQL